MKNFIVSIFCLVVFVGSVFSQTTVTTTHTNNNGLGSVTFNVQNTNTFDVIVTAIQCHLGTNAANNLQLLYRTTPFVDNATPWDFGAIGAGQNGWISAGTAVVNSNTANGIVPAISNMNITIPAGQTYQFGFSGTTIQYMTLTNGAGINTFSAGGVNILTGDGISWGGGSYPSTPANYPRGFIGGITFIPATPCVAPPTAGVVTPAANPICPSIDNILSLTGASQGTGQTYQWQSSTDGTNYTNIAGATNSTYTASQTVDTYYKCILTCSGQSSETAPVLVTTNSFLNCYCPSSATSTSDEEIFNVSISTLNNSSTCATTGGAGSTQSMYSNYTATVPAPILARTVNYPFSVQIGTCGGSFSNVTKVYIDFNQNGSFADPGETIFSPAASSTGPNTISGTVTIPATAALGLTRMRVVNVETSVVGGVNPCGTYTWGETEDYFVEIVGAPTCPQPTAFSVVSATNSSADFTWTVGGTETQWAITYGPIGFNPATAGTTVYTTTNPAVGPTTISGLPSNAFYQAYIRALCSSTDSSFLAGPVAFNTYGLGQYMEADTACGPGFIDISSTGTLLVLGDDDEAPITFPFPVYYQGSIVTEATLGNNGGLLLGSTTAQLTFSNAAMATAANGLYPFWDDMGSSGPGIWVDTVGVAPNRTFIIQWNKDHLGASNNPLNFQLQILESNMEIYFVYDDVIAGSTTVDNGGSATIGIAGPNQDIQLSFNNTGYLSNNSCAHFYYTDCPKPTNLTFANIGFDVADVDWSNGIANETEWTLEYGPAGFMPGTGTILTGLTTSNQTLPNLTQLTAYDVYVYAQCAGGDSSFALVGSFLTAPICADPTAVAATADIDSIFVTWNWAQTQEPLSYFNIQYHPQSSEMYTGVEYQGTAANFADTIVDASLFAGMTYSVYVQAVCVQGDTSSYVGPFNITMPVTNDTVCYAETLLTDGTVYNFVGTSATVNNSATPTEASIAPPITGAQTTTGWANATITKSTWFKFEAPATGQVRISGTDLGFDGQMAVYEVTDCGDFGTFELLAANDNEIGGSSLAPNFTVCGLTPGATYYLMHDPRSTSTTLAFSYSIKISAIDLEAGSAAPLLNICYGDTIDLFNTISMYETGGEWFPTNTNVALVQDSLFASTGLAYQTFNFQYRVTDGCAYDSIVSQVKIFPPSSAGNDGGVSVCRNEPVNLLAGLGGVFEAGGTWYDPTNTAIPSGAIISSNFPGQYNYDYIVGNGVCPDDTALVIVNVLGNCNFLELDELGATSIEIYPNPTEGIIQITNNRNEAYSVVVTDLNGRVIYQHANAILAESNVNIDLSAVETGLYLVKVYNSTGERVERILIK